MSNHDASQANYGFINRFGRLVSPLLFVIVFSSVHLCYFTVTTHQEKTVAEALLQLFISAGAIISFFNRTSGLHLTYAELACLPLIGYLLLHIIFRGNSAFLSSGQIVFFCILYCGMRRFFSSPGRPGARLLILATLANIFVFLVLSLPELSGTGGQKGTSIYLQNKSIFSIELASIISMSIPLWLSTGTGTKYLRVSRIIFTCIVLAALVLLFRTEGRSGWLGLILAMLYILCTGMPQGGLKRVCAISALPFFFILICFLYFYKLPSSHGRVLIYKVSLGMVRDNWLFGIGAGEFKIQYNKHQADFFSTSDINSREALLADHTVYAFNDYFQLIIEHGIIGFLLLLFAFFALLRLLWHSSKWQERRPEITSAAASLLCIATAAFFSYPIQIFPIIFQALVCLALINTHSGVAGKTIRFRSPRRWIQASLLLAGALFAGAVSYCKYQHAWKSARAFELQRAGFKQQALKTYEELSSGPIPDGHMLYMYARELYNSNQLHAAAAASERAKRYYSTNSLYKLSAQANFELKNFSEAERDYRMAVYMVPNRMLNRYDLLEHYLAMRDTANILYWSKSIIDMPVKVPSSLTSNIQAKARSIQAQFNSLK